MIDMNDFRYFVTIVDKGGFTAAGHALGLPTSTLSYRIKQLEGRLGLTLLLRSSRKLSLTEAGSEFYRHAVATVERADEAEHAMRDRITAPTGTIRYTTAIATAQFVLPEVINSFMLKYPEITLVQHVVDDFVDIIGERLDLAIRAHSGPLPDSNLIQRPLMRIPWQLFASPSYLSERGEPSTPKDLELQSTLFVRRENTQPRWSLSNRLAGKTEEVAISPRLSSTCVDCLKSATKAGIGIAALPVYLCKNELRTGELKPVLPDWIAADASLTALMPNRVGLGTSVRAFIDHIADACGHGTDGSS
jgi:DNA-binding transcriptional LysR family regulator